MKKQLIVVVAALGLLASAPVLASGDQTPGHTGKVARTKKVAKKAVKATTTKGGATATTDATTDGVKTDTTTGAEEAPPVTK